MYMYNIYNITRGIRMHPYASACIRMHLYASVCIRMHPYASTGGLAAIPMNTSSIRTHSSRTHMHLHTSITSIWHHSTHVPREKHKSGKCPNHIEPTAFSNANVLRIKPYLENGGKLCKPTEEIGF